MIDRHSGLFVAALALAGLSGCSWFETTTGIDRALTYPQLIEAEGDQRLRLEASDDDVFSHDSYAVQPNTPPASAGIAALTAPDVDGGSPKEHVEEIYQPDTSGSGNAAIHIALPDVSLIEQGSGATVMSPGGRFGGGRTGGTIRLNP